MSATVNILWFGNECRDMTHISAPNSALVILFRVPLWNEVGGEMELMAWQGRNLRLWSPFFLVQ